jgi:hypothetical protein
MNLAELLVELERRGWTALSSAGGGACYREPVLVYSVVAQREGLEPYSAVVSSTYVRRDGEWKLAFHQQTPT